MDCYFPDCERLWINVSLATFDPAVEKPYGLLEDHVLGTRGGRIAAILPRSRADLSGFAGEVIDGQGGLLTPGLIDCHTHLVYGGDRTAEFEKRLQGAGYEEISRAGGGILSTVRATRALDEEELVRQARPRLEALAREGVTTVEIKSGYGLTAEDELKMLRAARKLAGELPVRVRTTLLAAHVVPPEYRARPDDYVDLICGELIPRVAAEGLADAVDVFCESIAFTVNQAERLLRAARESGLGVKVHAEQLSNSGAALLAARCGAWSADHLEFLDEAGAQALRSAGTAAVLLPGPFYFLRGTRKPPVDLLRRLGVPMALATDLNPGTSPLASLRLMMNMGCTLFGLTPEEALAGVTRNAALALGVGDRLGTLAPGRQADLLLWDVAQPAQLVCEVGWGAPRQRVVAGEDTHV
ncbi:MAG TPA: imidazolonepropionase [Geobacter sp.]|nr:imidazolonepropionase [Geobacter sp.]